MTPGTVAFHTLGCKLNFSETSAIRRMFEGQGFATVEFNQMADIYVINTCSVTDFADRKCRNIVRKSLKQNPDARIVVMGCYAQLKPQEIAEIPGVDLVLGAKEKFRIMDFVEQIQLAPGKAMIQVGEVQEARTFEHSFSFGDRTRSFLKVQDGCDYKCTFCTIPQARGASRSDTVENVFSKAMEIAEMGVKEIVLTGVNIGDFGNGTEVIEGIKPKKESLFIDLIKALDEVEGIERFRISSIEPNLCTDEIISFVAQSNRFMPHLHMPIQSANNKQLKEMRRRYTRELFADRVSAIRKHMPHACIGVDVIVGFPGETDEDFNESTKFLSELDISYLHVFTYSERANTPAAFMENVVPMQVRKERNEILRNLSERKKIAHYEKFIGEEFPVLFEVLNEGKTISGFTPNYIKIEMPWEEGLVNKIENVKLGDFTKNGNLKAKLFYPLMV
jgi:threonylcarbamoyladenosine tRNA methylthiotransferase MtaB